MTKMLPNRGGILERGNIETDPGGGKCGTSKKGGTGKKGQETKKNLTMCAIRLESGRIPITPEQLSKTSEWINGTLKGTGEAGS